jgi:hypothetical protein
MVSQLSRDHLEAYISGPSLDELMARNDGLVHAVLRRQWGGSLDYEARLQAGRIGLWHAIVGYDPKHGATFSTYAWPAIEHEIWRAVRQVGPVSLAPPGLAASQPPRRARRGAARSGTRPNAPRPGPTPTDSLAPDRRRLLWPGRRASLFTTSTRQEARTLPRGRSAAPLGGARLAPPSRTLARSASTARAQQRGRLSTG